jgi:medium-chain acyl-[acyl-carrier-protein] hydrolase
MSTSVVNTPLAKSRWFAHVKPNPQASLRLFCFPYAGGSALIFRKWVDALPSFVEVCPVQLPGRGNRLDEEPISCPDALVRAVAEALAPHLDKPFALFGHSMGATISFELARLLRREGAVMPQHLFISGRRAPQVPDREPPLYNLPEQELRDELHKLGGTPVEVLEHPELMEVMLPLLRADLTVAETYVCTAEPPLDCPISVFGGLQDKDVTREDLLAWAEHTTGRFTLRMLAGDHFFLNTAQPLLLRTLSQELYQLLRNTE